jgi:protein farnesyltransferase/geranylgeranyltransferase type-1 subunit alpha
MNVRQWLVKRFDLWDQGELEYVNELIVKDVRNNSAWNHRFFILFGKGTPVSKETIEREIK